MAKLDMKIVEEVINEAVDKAVEKFGMEHVRKLSMFSSSWKPRRQLDKAA